MMLDTPLTRAAPRRFSQLGDIAPDDSAAVVGLLASGQTQGLRGALLTLVDAAGGSARSIGAQMAVLEDGRFAGYLSGGCVETAIAAEAVALIEQNRSAIIRLGAGSPFVDIRLPCGGSLDVLVSVAPSPATIEEIETRLTGREAAALLLHSDGRIELSPAGSTGWVEGAFRRTYLPALRLAVFGRGLEFEAVLRLANASGYALNGFAADDASALRLRESGIACARLSTPASPPSAVLDVHTAVLLLFHDHEWELPILEQALGSDCLYIGALGSKNTHQRRCDLLVTRGHRLEAIDRIRGPIGLFGPTRDASSLAISVLAELAQLQSSSRL